MRVAVVDVGSNSTRLYVADVVDGRVAAELDRRTAVTRLAEGVDASGELLAAAQERVLTTVAGYRERLDALGAQVAVAVLTSAVRDTVNGPAFAAMLRERFGLDARILRGEQEAALTFAGATGDRPPGDGPVVVVDVGGGSTELVAGRDGRVTGAASVQAGVVRQTERHLRGDPPAAADLAALRAAARATFAAAAREVVAEGPAPRHAVAVAGTATTCAAVLGGVEPYDPARVHGATLPAAALEGLLARLAALDLPARRAVPGMHPDRAPVIIAGVALLLEALGAFALPAVEVSEHDILRGAALAAVRDGERWTGV